MQGKMCNSPVATGFGFVCVSDWMKKWCKSFQSQFGGVINAKPMIISLRHPSENCSKMDNLGTSSRCPF